MAVDYAKKQAPKRKSAPKRKKAAAAKSRGGAVRVQTERAVSRRRFVLTLVLLVGFIALLVALKYRQAEETPVVTPQVQQEDPLPELPQERWRYPEELESKEVEVIVPERAESQPRLIQCASFRSAEDAESMRAQIAFLGLEAQVRATQGTSGMWYRVILGPFENQRAAQRTNHQLQRGGVYRCEIWNWTE
ncbi:SPOR domain-containing protein [Aliidiomarina celeris]|uniref:SPOR domain-containing protein n=1 Tax=Aliidiomarina celeris TaxID=2249428 RepID=UPI000DE9D546|nr:SPOR domain-containing protein [Aliidiomarina celeris]